MVSLFSLFSSKKRPKATDRRPTSPTSPRRARSVRNPTKSNGTFKADAARRASSEGGHALGAKRLKASAASAALSCTTAHAPSMGRSSSSPVPPRINISLPFEAKANDELDVSLGLDGVGRTPVLTAAERRVLDTQRYTRADLQAVWEWLGPEFATRGAETVGIMLPRRLETSKDRQRQLASLFVLARRPELEDKLPSLTSRYPTVPSGEAAEAWKSRLIAVAKDTPNPVDLAEVLKTILRRLAANTRPVIDPATYVRFVQQEHAASYPRVAYDTMLVPHLPKDVVGLLAALFEVVAAIALHADTNSMSAGRLCHLFGWWLLGSMPDGTTSWNDLYEAYRLAGQRAEHLFYARVRLQTTQQKMPRRLVQLILSYPFGESSASSEHLPLPPASTFPRRVLHVTLGTDSTLPTGTDPDKALGDALIAKLDDDVTAPSWVSIRGEDHAATLETVLSSDSREFLQELAAAKGLDFATPPATPKRLPEEFQYQPFEGRKRSMSCEIPRLDSAENVYAPGAQTVRRGVVRQSSAINLSPTRTSGAAPPQWDDFLQSGFDSSNGVSDLSFTLKKPAPAPLRLSANSGTSNGSTPSGAHLQLPKKRIISDGKTTTSYVISAEEIVEMDDGFIHFVEDGQLDPVASASWPRFALVQLAEPLHTPPNPDSVDWLLVTVKKREIKRAPSIEEPMPDLRSPDPLRPLSPSTGETSTSRFSTAFGFSSIANKFRRKSYFAELATHSTPSRSRSLQPITNWSRDSKTLGRCSAASDAPTEYTIGEMGEIVKIPSPYSSPPTSPPLVLMDPVLSRSAPSDWVYLGEGGAHVIFRYRGSDPALQGRALRLVKTEGVAADTALRQTWAAELLPKLVPADLLAAPTTANVEEKWTRAIVTPTELMRPAERRAGGLPLADSVDYARPAQLMDDLTCGLPGYRVVAVEIKPKWGFLPQAQHLTPPESIPIKSRNCRYCMHQHYRGENIDGTVYCPLDLYSGDGGRIRKALDGLWAQWKATDGDKNNLRIYLDGKMVLPSGLDQASTVFQGDFIEKTTDLIAPLLEKSAALPQLKHLQSTLDATNIADIARQFSAANPGAEPFARELVSEPTGAELTSFVQQYLADPQAGTRPDTWTLREREIGFMLSAIFKDCSMIVRAVLPVGRVDSAALVPDRSGVKLIDTDLKAMTHLQKWYKLDDKLWRHWAETRGSEEETVVIPAEPHPSYHNLAKTAAGGALAVAAGGGAYAAMHGSPNPDDSSARSIASVDAANTALASAIPDTVSPVSPVEERPAEHEELDAEIRAALARFSTDDAAPAPEPAQPERPERVSERAAPAEAPAAIVPAAIVPPPAATPAAPALGHVPAPADPVADARTTEIPAVQAVQEAAEPTPEPVEDKEEAVVAVAATRELAEPEAEKVEAEVEVEAVPGVEAPLAETKEPELAVAAAPEPVKEKAAEPELATPVVEASAIPVVEVVAPVTEEKVEPAADKVEELVPAPAEPVVAPNEPAIAVAEEPSSSADKKAGFAALAATGVAAGVAAAAASSKDVRSPSTSNLAQPTASTSNLNLRHSPSTNSLTTPPPSTLRRKTSDLALEGKSRVARISSLFNRRASQNQNPTPPQTPPSKIFKPLKKPLSRDRLAQSPEKDEGGFAARFRRPKKSGADVSPTASLSAGTGAAAAAGVAAAAAAAATAAVVLQEDKPEDKPAAREAPEAVPEVKEVPVESAAPVEPAEPVVVVEANEPEVEVAPVAVAAETVEAAPEAAEAAEAKPGADEATTEAKSETVEELATEEITPATEVPEIVEVAERSLAPETAAEAVGVAEVAEVAAEPTPVDAKADDDATPAAASAAEVAPVETAADIEPAPAAEAVADAEASLIVEAVADVSEPTDEAFVDAPEPAPTAEAFEDAVEDAPEPASTVVAADEPAPETPPERAVNPATELSEVENTGTDVEVAAPAPVAEAEPEVPALAEVPAEVPAPVEAPAEEVPGAEDVITPPKAETELQEEDVTPTEANLAAEAPVAAVVLAPVEPADEPAAPAPVEAPEAPEAIELADEDAIAIGETQPVEDGLEGSDTPALADTSDELSREISPHTPAMPIRETFSSGEGTPISSPYSPVHLARQPSLSAVVPRTGQFPRLSAFGDDLRISSPDLANLRQSPPVHNEATFLDGPTIVPTKSVESPTESPLRRADTAFPRLSAFIDKDQPGIDALRELGEAEDSAPPNVVTSMPTPIKEESGSLQPSPNVSTFADSGAPMKTPPLDAFGITLPVAQMTDSDASSLQAPSEARLQRSDAPSPSPHASDLGGVSEAADEPTEPAADESQRLAEAETVELNSPMALAPLAAPTIPRATTPTKIDPTATTPDHVERYEFAALPPLPHMREHLRTDSMDTTATDPESIAGSDAFATAPVSPQASGPATPIGAMLDEDVLGLQMAHFSEPATPRAAHRAESP